MPRKRIPHEVDNAVIEENAQSPERIIFAKTLNSLLSEKGVHQENMAQALGISTGSISTYRNGKQEPRLSVIIKIADYLGVDCHYLMTGVRAENRVSSKELGLSEKAINAIKELGEEQRRILNYILDKYCFFDILYEINKLALEESIRKHAEEDEKKAMSRRDAQDFTEKMTVTDKAEERRDVLEYRLLKKFLKLSDIVVSELVSHKDFQEYGAKMAEAGYMREAEFYSELYGELNAAEEAENNGKY